jgi:type I site-specific restriction endonuclease
MKTPSLTKVFGEPISIYTQQQAINDGFLIKVGKISNLPVVFTSNLFEEVKDHYQEIIQQGLTLLNQPNFEDDKYSKMRIIKPNQIWVIANAEGVTFMKPEDY